MDFENIILYIKEYGLNFVPPPHQNLYIKALTHNMVMEMEPLGVD